MTLTGVDLPTLFGLATPVVELVLRGSTVYWILFIVFRCVIRREFITEEEMLAQLRQEGIGHLSQVKAA